MKKHPLKLWCEAEGRKLSWVAEQLGISRSHLSGYLAGRSKVPLDRAVQMEDLTRGAVSARCWVPSLDVSSGDPEEIEVSVAVVFWRDQGDLRVSLAGWDGSGSQKDAMEGLASVPVVDLSSIESRRFMELTIPVSPPGPSS
jgi:DNA-binding transcriptional regulator YdaS (Cro superfamily)